MQRWPFLFLGFLWCHHPELSALSGNHLFIRWRAWSKWLAIIQLTFSYHPTKLLENQNLVGDLFSEFWLAVDWVICTTFLQIINFFLSADFFVQVRDYLSLTQAAQYRYHNVFALFCLKQAKFLSATFLQVLIMFLMAFVRLLISSIPFSFRFVFSLHGSMSLLAFFSLVHCQSPRKTII